jgi:mono/diheme cytochrome c family protein
MARYRGWRNATTAALLLAALLVAGAVSDVRADKGVNDGKALCQEKCGVCHRTRIVTSRKEAGETWEQIVKAMQGKRGGWISDAQARKIVEYLTAEYGTK